MTAIGKLDGDAVWSGDVQLEGDVVVPEGVVLRILPGTKLSAASKPKWSCAVFRSAPEGWPIEASERESCDLIVLGRLEMDGVVVSGAWGGITLLGNGRADLRGCRLEAKAPFGVQAFDDSRVEMTNCEVLNCDIGIWGFGLSTIRFRGGKIAAARNGALACEGAFISLRGVDAVGGDQAVRQEGLADVVAR